ncbi:MAG: DUF1566 domain-containing protein [Nitrospiraceae bacterium]
MTRSKWNRGLSGVGVVALIGGLALANFGVGVTSAEAHNHLYQNPFKQIMTKLDNILAKLNNGAPSSSSGGVAGNYTMRWDTNLPSASRFTVLTDFVGAAVRDNSTGLVWEQYPSTPATDWSNARFQCVNKNVGGTRGWRLPSVVELTSMLNQQTQGATPVVPSEFTGVQLVNYWSATTHAPTATNSNSAIALTLSLSDGTVGQSNKGGSGNVWCVRGAMQESVY